MNQEATGFGSEEYDNKMHWAILLLQFAIIILSITVLVLFGGQYFEMPCVR